MASGMISPVFNTEEERIKEQLAQAEALRQVGLKGNTGSGYQGGRVFIVGNPLGNIASGLAGAFMGDKARTAQAGLEQSRNAQREEFLQSMPSATEQQTYDPVANPGTGPLMNGTFEKPYEQQAQETQNWATRGMTIPGMEGIGAFGIQQKLMAPEKKAEREQAAKIAETQLLIKAQEAKERQAERLEAQRVIAEMNIQGRKDMAALTASLRASAGGKDEPVSQEAADFIAGRFLEGDQNALIGISRNKALHNAVMVSIATQAKQLGIDPKEAVQRGLEYKGAGAEQRTMGNQAANVAMASSEAYNMVPIVSDLSKKVPRTEFPTLNAAGNVIRKNTGDPNVVAFDQSIDSLINAYARAINPKGVATVADKKRAHEKLNIGFANGQVDAVLGVMQREIEAAKAAPVEARKTSREARVGGGEAKPGAAPTVVRTGTRDGKRVEQLSDGTIREVK